MFKEVRKEQIIDLLKEKGEYNIDDLCKYFGVSLATIHRDLDVLEREGRIRKVHGGVLLNKIEDIETRNSVRLNTNIELKKKIAKKGLEFVNNDECIFLDNSTTCYYFAKELSESKFKNLVIVTNSFLIPGLFIKNEDYKIVSLGGTYVRDLNCFVGPSAIGTLNEFNGDKFFLSTVAISIEGGLSDIYRPESDEIKKQMFKRSKESICLIDSTKFNKTGQSIVFSIKEVDKIITDNMCNEQIREYFLNIGKQLIIA